MGNKKAPPQSPRAEGRFSYDGLDRVLHEKARLGILASLATGPAGRSFGELKELCSLTDGNLNRHLAVLTEAGVVEVGKSASRGRAHTVCKLTAHGQARLSAYLRVLEKVVTDAGQVAQHATPTTTAVRPV